MLRVNGELFSWLKKIPNQVKSSSESLTSEDDQDFLQNSFKQH